MSENGVKKETLGEMFERLSPKKPTNYFIKISIRKKIKKAFTNNLIPDRFSNNALNKDSLVSEDSEKANSSRETVKKGLELRKGFHLNISKPCQKYKPIERSSTARPRFKIAKKNDVSMLVHNNTHRKSSKHEVRNYEILNFLKKRQKVSSNPMQINGIKILKKIS